MGIVFGIIFVPLILVLVVISALKFNNRARIARQLKINANYLNTPLPEKLRVEVERLNRLGAELLNLHTFTYDITAYLPGELKRINQVLGWRNGRREGKILARLDLLAYRGDEDLYNAMLNASGYMQGLIDYAHARGEGNRS